MATVSLGVQRRNEIENHLMALEAADLKTEIPEFVTESSLDGGRLLTLLQFNPLPLNVVDQIPRAWLEDMSGGACTVHVLPRTPKMVSRSQYGQTVKEIETLAPLFSVTYRNSTNAWFRPSTEHSYTFKGRGTSVTPDQLKQLATTLPGVTELQRSYELWPEVQAHKKKWSSIRAQIMALVNEARTVNSAVKAFPNLKFYLPPAILAELNREVTKAEARVLDVSKLDLETLAAVGVGVALTGGEQWDE